MSKIETFTIRVQVLDKDAAVWIHDSMKSAGKVFHGVKVRAISSGDMFQELDLREQEANILHSYAHPLLDESDQDKLEVIEEGIEDAGKRFQEVL